jgi:hypothetical protein
LCLCVESFPIRLCFSHATGCLPGYAAANRVERAGLHTDADLYAIIDTDYYPNVDRDPDSDTISHVDCHAITDTFFDTQPATVANPATANIDTGQQ